MTWVAFRLQRGALLTLVATTIVLGAYLAFLGARMHASIADLGIAACSPGADCAGRAEFASTYESVPKQLWVTSVLPLLLAMFVGAPLVARELERGTHRLAWMQSVSRQRWLLVKSAVPLAITAVCLLVLGLLVTWCCGPLVDAGITSRLDTFVFVSSGVVLAAYGIAAIAIGVACGTIIGKLLPAMAVALVGFLVVMGVTGFARPHYATPVTVTRPATVPDLVQRVSGGDFAMVTSVRFTTSDGTTIGRGGGIGNVDMAALARACQDVGEPFPASSDPGFTSLPSDACAQKIGLTLVVQYQPESAYWRFQGIESVIAVVLAIVLLAVAGWWVNRIDA